MTDCPFLFDQNPKVRPPPGPRQTFSEFQSDVVPGFQGDVDGVWRRVDPIGFEGIEIP
jgi:hypothetical protein